MDEILIASHCSLNIKGSKERRNCDHFSVSHICARSKHLTNNLSLLATSLLRTAPRLFPLPSHKSLSDVVEGHATATTFL